MQKDNLQRPSRGLHTDNSPNDQPKDTYRYALNTVNETELGDYNFLGNEESNEVCFELPVDYIPIGKVYLSDETTAIFLVSKDAQRSEIGIADSKNCKYTTFVNTSDLNFRIDKQIQATYRLRRGCERTVYFVDGLNKPRFFNFDSLENFQTNGDWDANKFELRRSYQSVPQFNNLTVLNSGGQLEPGSYNVGIQYLDEDLNPTEWVATSPTINIYNSDTDEAFLDIRGSINSDTDYIDFPTTDKAIKVDLSNIDQSFLFYRLAFIEATSGTGLISNVKFTEIIPSSKNFFIYTGVNFQELGTEEEIQAFSDIIDSAETIEQIENRLILGNTKGKQVNFCNLQKYASRIKSDVIIKPVIANQIVDGSSKNPTVNFEAAGYMPGEVYSFGIVYVFADGSISPVYHIPGKSPEVDNNVVFRPQFNGDNEPVTFAMKNNNQSLSNTYIDNSNCANVDYWGVDSEGDPLKDQPVRHHRFPLRSEVGVPLVEEIASNTVDNQFFQLTFTGTGNITIPCSQEEIDNGECTVLAEAPIFQARVEFTVDGVAQALVVTIDPADQSSPFAFTENSELFTSNNIIITGIFESVNGTAENVSGGGIGTGSATGGTSSNPDVQLNYTAEVIEANFSAEEKLFRTQVFGIQFSGVDLPDPSDINGKEIIGYYIVRNERTEDEKTILDSAAMFPCVINDKYISHGLLGPEFTNNDPLSKNVFGLVNPEFKFKNRKYEEFTDIIQEGEFQIIDRKKSKARYRDVTDGTSFDSDIHKSGGGRDSDGWSLKVVTRDNITRFRNRQDFNVLSNQIKNIFYLDALQSRDINDDQNSVYNIAADNKVGILELEDDYDKDLRDKIPYLYLRRSISDSYSTFRTLPYYKASNNFTDTNVTSVFGGDTYITPMRYANTVFYDNRIAERAGRTSVWNYVIGAILVVVGVVLAFFTAGASTIVVGAGIAIIGGGALFIASGVKKDALVRAYQDEYDKGLRETALDDWVDVEYKNLIGTYEGGIRGANTPEDDEIQWIGDAVTDLWFESKINISLRNGFSVDTPTFMDAPGKVETGNDGLEPIYEHFDVYKIQDRLLAPATVLDNHMMDKLVVFSPERGDSREYIGHPLGEYYNVNPDYERLNSQKTYFHLALEYDCCSECQEEFPHRVHYSQQSFQEELTDNYRVFLPNNYRDIEGEKGPVTNLYRFYNNLYIHTEEALWHLPQNYQERVTYDIVSFIGTGSYFETPPRPVVHDNSGVSAGTKHRHGVIKTKHGILFPNQVEGKWYLFNGNDLTSLSEHGMSNWFKENMDSKVAKEYYDSNERPYPFLNNPSNPYGEGFLSTYDTKKERFIITKKDFTINENLANLEDYEICIQGDDVIVFENFQQRIADREADGWTYVGIEDCQMKFSRTDFVSMEEDRQITTKVPNETDIHVFFDTSGSFGQFSGNCLQSIEQAVDDWVINFAADNPDWTGQVYKYQDGTERWLNYAQIIGSTTYSGQNLGNKDIIVLSFCNEASPNYHGNGLTGTIPAPTGTYISDYNDFSVLFNAYNSFIGIHYPIVFGNGSGGCGTGGGDIPSSRQFVLHSLAALKGNSYNATEAASLPNNPGFTPTEFAVMQTALQGPNPYPTPGLENLGWLIKSDRAADAAGNVIDPVTFQDDITELLEGTITVETIQVTIQVPVTTFETEDGVLLEGDLVNLNNSWTMSYSLKNKMWVSWHSYIPNFYFYISERFYSWKTDDRNMWKHNVRGTYQTFYGEFFPHIIEYISLSSPILTRIWNHIKLLTEAKRFVPENNQYVEERFRTFNKAIIYNSRQCSGEMNLQVKDPSNADYLLNQVVNTNDNTQIIDRNEEDWTLNDLRDIRIDYTNPIWNSSLDAIQNEYFTDKVLNDFTLDINKDWTQLESFRDKYLVIRLIFDTFADTKLLTNYTVENEQQSFR